MVLGKVQKLNLMEDSVHMHGWRAVNTCTTYEYGG
jgi:hypothetical protein